MAKKWLLLPLSIVIGFTAFDEASLACGPLRRIRFGRCPIYVRVNDLPGSTQRFAAMVESGKGNDITENEAKAALIRMIEKMTKSSPAELWKTVIDNLRNASAMPDEDGWLECGNVRWNPVRRRFSVNFYDRSGTVVTVQILGEFRLGSDGKWEASILNMIRLIP